MFPQTDAFISSTAIITLARQDTDVTNPSIMSYGINQSHENDGIKPSHTKKPTAYTFHVLMHL